MAEANFRHDTIERFGSYWSQVYESMQVQPKTLLEVGPGSYLHRDYLQRLGVSVTTLDVKPPAQPGVTGTVTQLPFQNNAFDVAVAYEVLEHVPFEDFSTALTQLAQVARQRVIISLPDCRYYFRFLTNAFSVVHRKSHGLQLQCMVSFPRIFHRNLPPIEVKLGGGASLGDWPPQFFTEPCDRPNSWPSSPDKPLSVVA